MSRYIEHKIWGPHSLLCSKTPSHFFFPVSQTIHLGCVSCLMAKEFGVIAGGDEKKNPKSPYVIVSRVLCNASELFFFNPYPDFSLSLGKCTCSQLSACYSIPYSFGVLASPVFTDAHYGFISGWKHFCVHLSCVT